MKDQIYNIKTQEKSDIAPTKVWFVNSANCVTTQS